MFEYILPLIALGVGFAGGYGIREWKSRRRRAIAQQEYFRRHPEEGHTPLSVLTSGMRSQAPLGDA